MKLSRLYATPADKFGPIEFRPGLNAVVAEIRLPKSRDADIHNLGKSTLGTVLDFCLLAGKGNQFLFEHPELFDEFVFFLELELRSGGYLTIRRGVSEASKVSFMEHAQAGQDFSDKADDAWSHSRVPFQRSKLMLDGLLDLRAMEPWGFRKGLGYLLRTQEDYRDVFQLARFAGGHADWKPYIASILGFDADIVQGIYEKEAELARLDSRLAQLGKDVGGGAEQLSEVEGKLLVKRRQYQGTRAELDRFDFREQDVAATEELVDGLDERIAELNDERYSQAHSKKRIEAALKEEQLLFSTDQAASLYEEAGVAFEGQLRRDFDQLVDFTEAISAERRVYLREELSDVDDRLTELQEELDRLGSRRVNSLAFLRDADVFDKYRAASDRLAVLQADLVGLDRRRQQLQELADVRGERRDAEREKGELASTLEKNVEETNSSIGSSLFTRLRESFDEIVWRVINRHALITVSPNSLAHLEFNAEILDEEGADITSADAGHTYRKLLCVAFDLALMQAHRGTGYPEFVYHDGVFEGLEPRKRAALLTVLRDYADDGFQQVITLLDSDNPNDGVAPIADEEVVLVLHDEGQKGRLFRMPAW